MSDTVTDGIRVQVESFFIPEQSRPAMQRYFFAYRVVISNEGGETVRLVSRHWIIKDGYGRVEEVKGPGVVGQQPELSPGTSFEYTSFCPLPTPIGSMEGTYQMVGADGRRFDARIDPFTLSDPDSFN